jgi:signal transduction histidine kinase/DNA-binding NarL/FixJ family response regulator
VFDPSTASATRLGNLLGTLGYFDVSTINNPRLALAAIVHSVTYDSMLVDLSLPDLEGLKLIYRIREQYSAAELPILAVADAESPEACNAALLAGANDYLVKPVDAINLALRLRNLLTINGIYNTTRQLHSRLEREVAAHAAKLNVLIDNSLLMATTREQPTLIRHTLFEGKRLLHCDAASMYLVTAQKTLRFAMRTRDDALVSNDLALFDAATGKPNERYVSTYCALRKTTVVIDDVYAETRFDLSGTREFDAHSGYRTVSLLTVPMITSDGKVVGVLQFINKIDPVTQAIGPFHPDLVAFVEALASQAAVALDNLALNEERMAQEEARRELGAQLAYLDRQRVLESLSASLVQQLGPHLSSILSHAQIAKRTAGSEAADKALQAQMLDTIIDHAQQANQTVSRIRGYARPHPGASKAVVLHDVLREVLSLLAAESRSKQVLFVLPSESESLQAVGNPLQISQIAMNVVRNAIDALQQADRREIHLTLRREGAYAVMGIRDTGPGMAADLQAQIGVPFFTTKPNGMGMGLAIARDLAAQMSGSLTVANAPEGGLLCELRLPLPA